MSTLGGQNKGKWLMVVALAAGVVVALTMMVVLAMPRRFIPRGVTNLSADPDLWSAPAGIGVSPDGDRVAVVWMEEVEDLSGRSGSVLLRWGSESTGDGWSPRVPVFSGTEQMCAEWPVAVAVTGTTAHVAYVVRTPCWNLQETMTTILSYTTCHLTVGGSCDVAQTITSTFAELGAPPPLYGVDIALDNEGNPHFVYVHQWWGYDSAVYYQEGGTDERVPDSYHSGNPAIAWSDGYAHVVWEEVDGAGFEIMYNRRSITGTWSHPSDAPTYGRGDISPWYPRNPDIAAYGDHVVVMWGWQWTNQGDQYVLAYTRYLTGTNERWMYAYEVGTQGAVETLMLEDWLRDPPYYTYTSTIDVYESPYLHRLQPSVVLDRNGLPTVLWHADNGTYDIMYSQAQSMTGSATGESIFSWSEPAAFHIGTVGDSGSPAVAQAIVISPVLHVAYLHTSIVDWETYYEGRDTGGTVPSNQAPYTPTNPIPADGASNVPITQTFSWQGGDPNGDSVIYTVAFGTSAPPSFVTTTALTSYTPELITDTVYYWAITATDGISAVVGPTWQFTTAVPPPNQAPYTPTNPIPADRASNLPLTQTLSWQGGDPDGDSIAYVVSFGTSDPPPIVDITALTNYVPSLIAGTSYYWTITANDGTSTVVGPTWQFATLGFRCVYLPTVLKNF
ncbi:MAG: hypothetical protein GY832_25565 [Chloroflexi bacterium]|nr:hypothetical protein [Chloroflexota bacterium]